MTYTGCSYIGREFLVGLSQGGLKLGSREGHHSTCIAVSNSRLKIVIYSTRMQYFRLLLIHCRYFHDPQPEYRVISDAVSIFLSEVARSLKCGVNRACSFSFSFRTDAFKCLFGGI